LSPTEIEISRHIGDADPGAASTVKFIASAGAVVRLELLREESGDTVEAEITRERYRELGLQVGDLVDVSVRPSRVFASH